ncbi:ArsR/SmtB family transcription factor [Schleiferilactobacillus perolens]|jgi:DNA-binding transcriptional ArsR family regulator|uniref:ArsR/SmtB family transcription factor n=1 Tax=Schleiferilactobacillus perolens TaxID=100468 RepID=UPI0023536199|nr:metalloregulator ArsR/SmtB family transcription factor [Schleiferilactobacillus perolens]MCI2171340.1 metalloregulator ArsR/SmtB family transcription factor [Schleiferilactobacillus perolens]
MVQPELHRIKVEFDSIQEFLLAVGDEKRQAIIIALLHQVSSKGLRVTDFTDITGLSRPAVSHHLKILKQAGIIAARSEGTKNYYYLSNISTSLKQLQQLSNDMLAFLATKEG